MKRIIALILLVLLIAGILTGCGKVESTLKICDIENVTIRITNISSTGATVIIKDTNTEPFIYGEWYKIEKEEAGKWYAVETVIDSYGFSEIGYLIDELSENREITFNIDWEWLYGKLPSGKYRLLKQVNSEYIAVIFDIA